LTEQRSAFVSYCKEDEENARVLATYLKQLGLNVWLDTKDLHAGQVIIDVISRTIEDSDIFFVCLSPTALKSGWVKHELNTALTFEANKGSPKVMPILLTHTDIPSTLASRLCIDMTESLEEAKSKIQHSVEVLLKLSVASKDAATGSQRQSIIPDATPPVSVVRHDVSSLQGSPDALAAPRSNAEEVFNALRLTPNARAQAVLQEATCPYRAAIDDFIFVYVGNGWAGHRMEEVSSVIQGRLTFEPEVKRVAREYRETRPDKVSNMDKLALVDLIPYSSDRRVLQLIFQEMRYFDFEGPRRALYEGDSAIPTSFARKFYFGKDIPAKIPTPLTCVHIVLVLNGHLVLGIRRKAFRADSYYDNHLCVGFEEQMSPEDLDPFGTVRRGLREEVGIQSVDNRQITLLHIGLEASFFSCAVLALVSLDCEPRELHDSIQLKAKDHEWDPIFVPSDTDYLIRLLKNPAPRWSELEPAHFLKFAAQQDYKWHGTSRARLFAFLAWREGLDHLGRLATSLR
jgi:hypothetical protein